MVSNVNYKLVDLVTSNNELWEHIFDNYSGRIFENNIKTTKTSDEKFYGFLKLDYELLREVLSNKNYMEYTIFDSQTKEVIEDN